MKVAVYGTLRKGYGNHHLLKDCKYLGKFQSNPEYIMASIGDRFPGIRKGGYTPITFEVYDEVDITTMKKLDGLEGFNSPNDTNNLYNRKAFDTPWGRACIYLYNRPFNKTNTIIDSGDWEEYILQQKIKTYA